MEMKTRPVSGIVLTQTLSSLDDSYCLSLSRVSDSQLVPFLSLRGGGGRFSFLKAGSGFSGRELSTDESGQGARRSPKLGWYKVSHR